MKHLFAATLLLSSLLVLPVNATSHLTGKIIALDAGHGSSTTDVGATGNCNGTLVKEVDVNLKVRAELKTKLETDGAVVFEVPQYSSRKEIREQSKMGVSILRHQLYWLGIAFLVIAGALIFFSRCIFSFCQKRIKLVQNICFLFIIIVFLLIFGEVFLRLIFAEQLNQEYGYGPGYLTLAKKIPLNSLGFRDAEHTVLKDASTKRILILGDSMTYGAGIKDFNQVYGRVLQTKLDLSRGSGKYEIIILAKPGHSTYDELITLKNIGLNYEPDIIVLGYHLNDAEGYDSRIGFEKLYFRHYFIRLVFEVF